MAKLYEKYYTSAGQLGTLVDISPANPEYGTIELDDKSEKRVVFEVKLSELKSTVLDKKVAKDSERKVAVA